MAALSGMITKFVGVESAPIRFEASSAQWSVKAGSLVSIAATPAMGIDPAATEPLTLGNTGHPANSNVSLAHAAQSQVTAFGFLWNDSSGRNNGQYAPFTWANT